VAAQRARPRGEPWDLAWLDAFKGRHRQVYDLIGQVPRETMLHPPSNYLEAHKELSGLEFPDINVVIGTNGAAFPITASDALWARFKFGERWNIKDPDTGQPATRNVYLGQATGAARGTVRALQARGAVFWMCNMALNTLSVDFGNRFGRPATDVYAEFVEGLLPGVRVVPAHTWAIGLVQERGFTYEKL
jgi:hypothetical protein